MDRGGWFTSWGEKQQRTDWGLCIVRPWLGGLGGLGRRNWWTGGGLSRSGGQPTSLGDGCTAQHHASRVAAKFKRWLERWHAWDLNKKSHRAS